MFQSGCRNTKILSYWRKKMNNLHLQKLALVSQTEKKRNHFRYKVREKIKKLSEENFTLLAIECLHSNHYPLLEEYLRYTKEWKELPHKDKACGRKSKTVNDILYLLKSHRKTIEGLLTGLEVDGYSAEVVEWLIINKEWREL
jgi:hypothetical protein